VQQISTPNSIRHHLTPITRRRPAPPVVLGQSSNIAHALIRQDLLAVVVGQVHVSPLSFSTAASL
jgi:hypothetical protein